MPIEITRDRFESASADLLARLRKPIVRALDDARVDPAQLSEVILVGGATRMPMVRQLITRLFRRLPMRLIDPDETIARGAAIQAALKARDAGVKEFVLTDVMPYSMGVVVSERVGQTSVPDRFSPIIERNTPVPVSRQQTYSTVADGQTKVLLDVRQGESPVGSENLAVASIEVPVASRPAGESAIDVRFSYDVNGLLDIDVREPGLGRHINHVVQLGAERMTPAEIAASRAKLAALKLHPRYSAANRYVVDRAKRLYAEKLGSDREAVSRRLAIFEQVLNGQEPRDIAIARVAFDAYLDKIDRGFVL